MEVLPVDREEEHGTWRHLQVGGSPAASLRRVSHPYTQCAAVSSQSPPINEAPQTWRPLQCRDTIQGHAPFAALTPPTTLWSPGSDSQTEPNDPDKVK